MARLIQGPRAGLLALVLLLITALALAGCGGGASAGGSGGPITVKMSDFKFEPSTITVKAGQPVKVTIENVGIVRHDWTVKGLDQPLTVVLDPKKSQTIEFTPTKPGTYEIVCTEPGHLEAGMKGQLIVQ